MNDINFDLGVKTFNLAGRVSVSFNPTDLGFLEKIYDVLADLDQKQTEYETKAKNIDLSKGVESGAEFFALSREADKHIRGKIDELFGADVAAPLLGDIHSYARNSEGLPIWLALLMAVLDQMEGSIADADKQANARIRKYTAKYSKRIK